MLLLATRASAQENQMDRGHVTLPDGRRVEVTLVMSSRVVFVGEPTDLIVSVVVNPDEWGRPTGPVGFEQLVFGPVAEDGSLAEPWSTLQEHADRRGYFSGTSRPDATAERTVTVGVYLPGDRTGALVTEAMRFIPRPSLAMIERAQAIAVEASAIRDSTAPLAAQAAIVAYLEAQPEVTGVFPGERNVTFVVEPGLNFVITAPHPAHYRGSAVSSTPEIDEQGVLRWGGPGYDHGARGSRFAARRGPRDETSITVDSTETAFSLDAIAIAAGGAQVGRWSRCGKTCRHLSAPWRCAIDASAFEDLSGAGEFVAYAGSVEVLRVAIDLDALSAFFRGRTE
jgi:hypothetical protein